MFDFFRRRKAKLPPVLQSNPKDLEDEAKRNETILIRAAKFEQMYEETQQFTPDLLEIEQRGGHLVFICDYMSQMTSINLYQNGFEPQPHGIVFTKDEFTFFKCRRDDDGNALGLGCFGIPLEEQFNTVPSGRIKGDLFCLPPEGIRTLDSRYQNGVQFCRKRVDVIFPYSKVLKVRPEDPKAPGHPGKAHKVNGPSRFTVFKASMYVGVYKHWREKIDAGFQYQPVGMFQPNRPYFGDPSGRAYLPQEKPYYYFSKKETED